MKKVKLFYITILACIPAALALLSLVNQPSTDDYCYANQYNRSSFVEAAIFWYNKWSGRYISNTFLSLSEYTIKHPILYKVIPIIYITALLSLTYLIIRKLFKDLSKTNTILITLSFFTLFVYAMPITSQGFYWLAGSLTYMLSLVMVLAFLASVLYNQKILAILSLIIMIGCNETILLPIIFICSLYALYTFAITKTKRTSSIVYLSTSITCSIFVYLSPGNTIRLEKFERNKDIMQAISDSFLFTCELILKWILTTPLIPILLLTAILINRYTQKNNIALDRRIFDPVITTTLPFVIVFLSVLASFYSQGTAPVARSLNIAYFLFVASTFLSALTLSRYIYRLSNKIAYALIIVIIPLLPLSLNLRTAVKDLGRIEPFYEQLVERKIEIQNCRNSKDTNCAVTTFKKPPTTVFNSDVTKHKDYFSNKCVARYYKLESIIRR